MFFALSKVLWALVVPGNLLLIALCLGVVLAALGRRRGGWAFIVLATLGFLALATLPVGMITLQDLENRIPPPKSLPERVGGIVVLGGMIDQFISQERGQPAVGAAVERLTEFAALARRYPEAKLVFSGGSGRLSDQTVKEADQVGPFLQAIGMDTKRILFEADSRNTYENAELSKRVGQPAPGEPWILITSAFHMPRALGSFRKAGWTVIPYPVDYMTSGGQKLVPTFDLGSGLSGAGAALHEWLGLTFYYLTGRTSAWYPAPSLDDLGQPRKE